MKRIKKAATLIITTIVLSFVTITTAVFSVIYFRYGQMNNSYSSQDKEKITLVQNANDAYKRFLLDDDYESGKLRSYWLANLGESLTFFANFSSYSAKFSKAENNDYNLQIDGNKYSLYSLIDYENGTYSLKILTLRENAF